MTMMKPSGIVQQVMKERGRTVIEFSRDAKVSAAIVYAWLNKEKKVSKRTIRLWLLDPEIPDYIKAMARELNGERNRDGRAAGLEAG